jgi:hypothetical protein
MRLASLIVARKGLFFPILDSIMHEPSDSEIPGTFLKLFPHPLSRLLMVLLWKINSEQDGDAVVLSNVWLRSFAKLDNKSLLKYRRYLNDHKLILAVPLGSGREHLYRIFDPNSGLPLSDETHTQAVRRLRNLERIREVARKRVMRKYRKHNPSVVEALPLISPAATPVQSGWDGW